MPQVVGREVRELRELAGVLESLHHVVVVKECSIDGEPSNVTVLNYSHHKSLDLLNPRPLRFPLSIRRSLRSESFGVPMGRHHRPTRIASGVVLSDVVFPTIAAAVTSE